jgi:hypothetical protein
MSPTNLQSENSGESKKAPDPTVAGFFINVTARSL